MREVRIKSWVLVVCIGFASVSCGSQSGDSNGEELLSCVPGEVETCPCLGKEQPGTQRCADDGASWAACLCEPGQRVAVTDADSDSDTSVNLGSFVFSCNLPSQNHCQEYHEPMYTAPQVQALEMSCDQMGGTSSSTSKCPLSGCDGTCDSIGTMGLTMVYYNGTGLESTCVLGEWTA